MGTLVGSTAISVQAAGQNACCSLLQTADPPARQSPDRQLLGRWLRSTSRYPRFASTMSRVKLLAARLTAGCFR